MSVRGIRVASSRRGPLRALLYASCVFLLSVSGPARVAVAQSRNAAALCDSADALLARGDAEGAFRHFQEAGRKDRRSVRAFLGMGRSMLEVRAGGTRALKYFSDAVRLAPEDPETHFMKAMGHIRLSEGDIGRDNVKHAVRELERVLELNPSHGRAWYELGRLRRHLYEDLPGAIEAYRNQIEVDAPYPPAWMELLESYVVTGQWRSAAALGEVVLVRMPDSTRAYPYVAASHWMVGDVDRSMDTFRRYFDAAPPGERELYFDLSLVMTPQETADFVALDDEGRRYYLEHYWEVRDPDPRTDLNERLLEHYIRVAYSRLEFGGEEWPWDARGTFYVRYGEPDLRLGPGRPYPADFIDEDIEFISRRRRFEEEMGLPFVAINSREEGGGRGWASKDPERWIYLGRGIDIRFEDPAMSGRFMALGGHTRQLIEQMEKRVPVMSKEEDRIARLDPLDTVVTFRGEGGLTTVEYAFALQPEEFGPFKSADGAYALLDISVRLYTPDWMPVSGASDADRRVETMPQVTVRGLPLFVDSTRLDVRAGDYVITTLLVDPEGGGRADTDEFVSVPDYSGTGLMISDLLTAARITEAGPGRTGRFIRRDLEVLPLPGATVEREQPLFIYYEVYNLSKDAVGGTDYTVEYEVSEMPENRSLASRIFRGIRDLVGAGPRRAVLASEFTVTGIRSDVPSWFQMDMSLVPGGTYHLTVTITDNVSGATAANSTAFRTIRRR